MQQILIHTISISAMGQIRFFEIPIPRDAAFITAIDYRIRMLDETSISFHQKGKTTPFLPEPIIGILSLSSNQREGLFFYANLILETRNAGMLDCSEKFFKAFTYNRNPMPEPLNVRVNGKTTSINGFFRDSWGISQEQDTEYEVSIYLHYKKH